MNPAAWAWVGLAVLIAAYVLGFDLWAQATGHATMSGQFHDWMASQVAGPLVVAGWAGVTFGLLYHFLINR